MQLGFRSVSDQVVLREYIDTVLGTLATASPAHSDGVHIKFWAYGSDVACWVDGTMIFQKSIATNFLAATAGDIDYANGTDGVITNFMVYTLE